MDPLTLFVIGQTLQMGAGIAGGRAEASGLNRQADVLRGNAVLAGAQGAQSEAAQRRQFAQFAGEQRASTVQSGIDASSGTALDVQKQSAVFGELDAMTIRYEAQMRSLGLLQEAEFKRAEAKDARRATVLNAGAGLLSSVGQYGAMVLNAGAGLLSSVGQYGAMRAAR